MQQKSCGSLIQYHVIIMELVYHQVTEMLHAQRSVCFTQHDWTSCVHPHLYTLKLRVKKYCGKPKSAALVENDRTPAQSTALQRDSARLNPHRRPRTYHGQLPHHSCSVVSAAKSIKNKKKKNGKKGKAGSAQRHWRGMGTRCHGSEVNSHCASSKLAWCRSCSRARYVETR